METKERLPVAIRWMISRDEKDVTEVERLGFGPDAWTWENFKAILADNKVICLVAEPVGSERVVAYAAYRLRKTCVELLSMAVHPDARDKGVGAQILDKLKKKLSSHHRTRLELIVDDANLGAQLFFKSQGLRATHVLRRHFDDGADAYRMAYLLPGHAEEPAPAVTPVNRVSQYTGE